MSHAHCIVSQNPSGYGLTDGRCFPCSGVPGRSVTVSPYPNHKVCTQLRIAFPKCMYTGASFVCKAGSSGHRRNPDFSRQKHGFRGKNRSNEERENFEDLDESEMFSSKNGSLLSFSSSSKFQATAAPGRREKEIVELFRKVQAQLRERAALKEERRLEGSQGKGKESETVDSLLKLLRKHSVEQGKKSSSSSIMDQTVARSEESGPNNEHKRSSPVRSSKKSTFFGSNNRTVDEVEETGSPALNRPASNFRRKSPVPHVKYQPVSPPHEDISNSVVSTNSMSLLDSDGKNDADSKWSSSEPGLVSELVECVIGPEADEEDSLDGSEGQRLHIGDAAADDDDGDDDEDGGHEHEDLSELKLAELKAMAKSRGVKGYSKMKKAELVELLGSNTSV